MGFISREKALRLIRLLRTLDDKQRDQLKREFISILRRADIKNVKHGKPPPRESIGWLTPATLMCKALKLADLLQGIGLDL